MNHRRILALLIGLFIALATMVIPSNSALAVGCTRAGCTGLDPNNQGCSPDARTIDEFTYSGARFELRYSPACYAAWTRVTSPVHFNTLFAQIRSSIGQVYGVQVLEGQGWTKMINFERLVKSCAAPWFDASPYVCTPYH